MCRATPKIAPPFLPSSSTVMDISGLIIPSLCLLFISATANAQDCQALATQGNCSFYRECVEKRIPGGVGGYSLYYGERYCKRFDDNIECFNMKVLYAIK